MTMIDAKPYKDMTLADLREDHARWVAMTGLGGPMASIQCAHDCRDIVATWLDLREREEMAAAGTTRDFACQACGAAVEMLAPVRRDAPDLVCACGGSLTPAEEAAEQRRVA